MAWGILMAGMTVFGMLGLMIAAVRADEESILDDQVGNKNTRDNERYQQAA